MPAPREQPVAKQQWKAIHRQDCRCGKPGGLLHRKCRPQTRMSAPQAPAAGLEGCPAKTACSTARHSRNQTGVTAVVSPITRSRCGMKIFARGEDFRGLQYRRLPGPHRNACPTRECLPRRRVSGPQEGLAHGRRPTIRRRKRAGAGDLAQEQLSNYFSMTW